MRPLNLVSWIVLGAVGVTCGAVSPAWGQAQPPGQPPPAAPASAIPAPNARDAYKQAVEAFDAGDFAAAYRGFSDVWAQEKKPKVAGNLGRTELKLRKYCSAIEHLGLFLREQPDLTPAERKDVEALLGEAKENAASLRVEVSQPGADVLVDGAPVGPSPVGREMCMDPGKHRIEARLATLQAAEDVEVVSGAKVTRKLELAPRASQEPAKGPQASPAAPAPGTTVGRDGSGARPFPTRTVIIVAGGGLALAGIVAGAAMLGVSDAKRAESDKFISLPVDQGGLPGNPGDSAAIRCAGDYSTRCDANSERLKERDSLKAAGVGVIVGGSVLALGALGVLGYTLFAPQPKAASVRVLPAVGAGQGGVLVVGRW